MKTKPSKQAKPVVQLKDLKPRKEAKAGANGGVWKTTDGGAQTRTETTRQTSIVQDL